MSQGINVRGIAPGDELKALAQRAWLAASDDISFSDEFEPTAAAIFKLGFLVGLQLVGQASRTKPVQAAIRDAVELGNVR
jgi:hypothetical protein